MIRRGFTLVEVMFAVGLSGLVMTGLYQMVFSGSRSARRTELSNDAMDQVGTAFLEIADRVRHAQRIDAPGPGGKGEVLEVADVATGAWRIQLLDGAVVVEEVLGFEKRQLGWGFTGLHFERDPENEHLLYVTFERAGPRGPRVYRSAIYARGTRGRRSR